MLYLTTQATAQKLLQQPLAQQSNQSTNSYAEPLIKKVINISFVLENNSVYQLLCKSSLIATYSLITYVFNLSVVSGASNMHAVPLLHKLVVKNYLLLEIIF